MLTNGKNYIHSLYNGTTKTCFISSIRPQGLLLPTSHTVSRHWWIWSYMCPRIGGLDLKARGERTVIGLAELFFLLCEGLIC